MNQGRTNYSEEIMQRRKEASAWFTTFLDALAAVDFKRAANAVLELRKLGIAVRMFHKGKGGSDAQ